METLLICAATEPEIGPLLNFLRAHAHAVHPGEYEYAQRKIHLLITGVGMMQAAFSLGTALSQNHYDKALLLGIAGTFRSDISLGEVVEVVSERYGDLGAEDREDYLDITELGFLDGNAFPFREARISYTAPETLKTVSSISVNTVSGNSRSIRQRRDRYEADIENMEGIAFHYACSRMAIPYRHIRAISNYVTPRDRSSWEIGKAIQHLNVWAVNYISEPAEHR